MNKLLLTTLFCLASNQALARCEPSVAKNYPGYIPPDYYGNGQTDSFRCAINGSTDLSSLQQSERDELIPEKLSNRFFIRLGANASSEGITKIKNKSYYDALAIQGSVNNKSTKTASNNIEMAFGYTWSDFAIDLEWLSVKSMTYNGALVNITPVISYFTTVKGDALLGNLSWNFKDMYNFKFYGLMSLGISSNQTYSRLSTGSANVIKKKTPAFGLGLGARFNLVSKLYADMAVRGLFLGSAKFEAANGAGRYIILEATRTWIGVSARLMWLI